MRKFRFLFKPLLFIFNLLFATWLVLKIEKLQPSDFGRHKHFFEPARIREPRSDRQKLKQLMKEYKEGKLNEDQFEKALDRISGH